MRFESKKLRDSARGQPCAFRIPGVCCGDWETTVLCHDRRGHFGMGCKPDDFCAAFGCARCHAAMDRQHKMPSGSLITADEAAHYWNQAKNETLRRWFDSGVVVVA